MRLRKTEEKDRDEVTALWEEARVYFREQGIDQWQDGYPNAESLAVDMETGESYVLTEETPQGQETVLATAFISFRPETDYDVIYGGVGWQKDLPYAVIHRVAVENGHKGQGLAALIVRGTEELCREKSVMSIRMDTHEDNRSMRRFLTKSGFIERGRIRLGRDGAERIAYEKIL